MIFVKDILTNQVNTMKRFKDISKIAFLLTVSVSFSGCYTQFVTADQKAVPKDRYSDYYSWNGDHSETNQVETVEEEDAYYDHDPAYGDFYYKDYEVEHWYRDHHANGLDWYRKGYMDGFYDGAYRTFSLSSAYYRLWPSYFYHANIFHLVGTNLYYRGPFVYSYWGYEYWNGYFTSGFYDFYYYRDPYYYYRDFYTQYYARTADNYVKGPRRTGLRSLNMDGRSRGEISKRSDGLYRDRSSTTNRRSTGLRTNTGRTRTGSSAVRSTGRVGNSKGSSVGRSRSGSGRRGTGRSSGNRSRNNDGASNLQALSVRPISIGDLPNNRIDARFQKVESRNTERTSGLRRFGRFMHKMFLDNSSRTNINSDYRRSVIRNNSNRSGSNRVKSSVNRPSSSKVTTRSVNNRSRSTSSGSTSKRSRGGN